MLLIGAVGDLVSNRVEMADTNLSQNCVPNMIAKYVGQLILGVGGCVRGDSSYSLKVVSQVHISCRDSEAKQGPKVSMV